MINAVAAQAREQRGYEGNELVASNAAYASGLRNFDDLADKTVAIDRLGSSLHYQLGQIARAKGFALAGVTLKPLHSLDAIAQVVETARSMPPSCRRNMRAICHREPGQADRLVFRARPSSKSARCSPRPR